MDCEIGTTVRRPAPTAAGRCNAAHNLYQIHLDFIHYTSENKSFLFVAPHRSNSDSHNLFWCWGSVSAGLIAAAPVAARHPAHPTSNAIAPVRYR